MWPSNLCHAHFAGLGYPRVRANDAEIMLFVLGKRLGEKGF